MNEPDAETRGGENVGWEDKAPGDQVPGSAENTVPGEQPPGGDEGDQPRDES